MAQQKHTQVIDFSNPNADKIKSATTTNNMAQKTIKTILECTYLEDNIINSNWKYLLKLSEMKDKTYQERGKFGRTLRTNSKKPKTK